MNERSFSEILTTILRWMGCSGTNVCIICRNMFRIYTALLCYVHQTGLDCLPNQQPLNVDQHYQQFEPHLLRIFCAIRDVTIHAVVCCQ